MSITAATPRVKYACNGSNVNFSFSFPILEVGDLQVIKRTVADGTEEVLDYTTDYTIYALNNDFSAGGIVTTVGAAFSSDYELCMLRVTGATQETDYTDGSSFPAESHEDALDKLTMMVQEIREQLARCLMVPASEVDGTTNLVLPDKIDRESKALSFDTDGNPVVS